MEFIVLLNPWGTHTLDWEDVSKLPSVTLNASEDDDLWLAQRRGGETKEGQADVAGGNLARVRRRTAPEVATRDRSLLHYLKTAIASVHDT